jgi:hypothetical protein
VESGVPPMSNLLMSMFLLSLRVSFHMDNFLWAVVVMQAVFSKSMSFTQTCEKMQRVLSLVTYNFHTPYILGPSA